MTFGKDAKPRVELIDTYSSTLGRQKKRGKYEQKIKLDFIPRHKGIVYCIVFLPGHTSTVQIDDPDMNERAFCSEEKDVYLCLVIVRGTSVTVENEF